MEKKNAFLEHIAGLRGVAIIFVLLFHLNGQAWAHGYLGVDVFLVITGYLLFRGWTQNRGEAGLKDTWGFIRKRLVRIVPPMVILIFLALAIGLLFLGWQDEKFLGIVGTNACCGYANIKLAHAFNDYFAADSAFIPLLHMWYLSVTLQVYLLWAVGSALLQRMPRRWLIAVLCVIAALSLGYQYSFPVHEWLESVGLCPWEQKQGVSYYATLPRLWEVLAGGAVFLLPALPKRTWATFASALGLCGIVLPALMGEYLPVPLSLTGVVGTALVIRYLPESHLNAAFCTKPLLWLGGISFSVYLVHMPIIVYTRIWEYGQLSVWIQAGIVALSIAAGWVFWWAVEKRRFPLWAVVLLWLVVFFSCRYVRKHNGFRDSFATLESPVYTEWSLYPAGDSWNPQIEAANIVFKMMRQAEPRSFPTPLLTMGSAARPANVALMGDSHAACLYAGLDHVGREEGLSGLYLSSVVTAFHHMRVYLADNYQFHPEKEAALIQWLSNSPEITHVVISQRWRVHFLQSDEKDIAEKQSQLREFLLELKSIGKKVVIIGPQPEFLIDDYFRYERVRKFRGQKLAFPVCTREKHLADNAVVYPLLRQMEEEGLCVFIDPLEALQPGEAFLSVRDQMMQMQDDDHMYCGNAIWLVRRLLPQLRRALPMTPHS